MSRSKNNEKMRHCTGFLMHHSCVRECWNEIW